MISFLIDFFPLQNNDQKSFYAVFDGHAGMEAASYAAAHVPYHFVKSESFPRDPPGALKTAFKSTDENFIVKLSTIFQLYRGSKFYWFRKPEYTDLPQVTDKLYDLMF
jgi:serine/threonine protein phosphatase PrpC